MYQKKLLYVFTMYLTMIIILSVRKIIYWLEENAERYITFSIPKEVSNIEENIEEITKTIFFRLQLIDRARFKGSSLLNLVNNLVEGIHKLKCKSGHNNKTFKTCGIKYKDCNCFLGYTNFKDDLIEYKCLCCNKNYKKSLTKTKKHDVLIHTNFLTMISISLFCYLVFTVTNVLMIGKNSMKHDYLKKLIFTFT